MSIDRDYYYSNLSELQQTVKTPKNMEKVRAASITG